MNRFAMIYCHWPKNSLHPTRYRAAPFIALRQRSAELGRYAQQIHL